MASLNNTIDINANEVEVDSILKIPILSAVDRSYGGSRGDICTGLEDSRLYIHNGVEYVPVSDDTPIITNHNSMLNLQGGNSTERYHLTEAERDAVITIPTISTQISKRVRTDTISEQTMIGPLTCAFQLGGAVSLINPGNNPMLKIVANNNNFASYLNVDTDGDLVMSNGPNTGSRSEKMRIKQDGKVNIGTLEPSKITITDSYRNLRSSPIDEMQLMHLYGVGENLQAQLDARLINNLATYSTQTMNGGLTTNLATGTIKLGVDDEATPALIIKHDTNKTVSFGGRDSFTGRISMKYLGESALEIDGLNLGIRIQKALYLDYVGAGDYVPIINSIKRLVPSSITPTELEHLSGVTSNIQSQLGAKAGLKLWVKNGFIYNLRQSNIGTVLMSEDEMTITVTWSPPFTYVPYVTISQDAQFYSGTSSPVVHIPNPSASKASLKLRKDNVTIPWTTTGSMYVGLIAMDF